MSREELDGGTRDGEVGANIAALRGERSQASLAASMRERGWKWSQPTVAAIEKGDRSLKFAEAVDLAEILGLPSIEELTDRPIEILAATAVDRFQRAERALLDAVSEFYIAQFKLGQVAEAIDQRGDAYPNGEALWTRLITKDPVGMVAGVKPLVPVTLEQAAELIGSSTKWIMALATGPYGVASRERGDGDGSSADAN